MVNSLIPGNAGHPLFDPDFAPNEGDLTPHPKSWAAQHEDPGEDITDISPLSDETIKALAEAGIHLSEWQPQIMTEEDAEHVLAFHKFLTSGKWQKTEEGEPIFMVDQASFDYATGKITSKEYLDG